MRRRSFRQSINVSTGCGFATELNEGARFGLRALRGSCTLKTTFSPCKKGADHVCLVKEVAAAALHLAVQSRQTLAGLFTILATFLLS